MPGVNISVDVGPMVQWLTDVQTNQIPYATSRAVNDLATEVQAAIQDGMRERFTIRRDWVLKGVRIAKFSNKKDNPIMATIDIAPDRDFMSKFESGGQKHSRVGKFVAVPTPAVRGSRAGIVPDSLRPRAFGFQASTTKLNGTTQYKGMQRTFIIETGAHPGIYQRTGSNAVRLLYKFFKSVPIPMTLRFHSTAQARIDARWAEIFRRRLSEALASAR